LFNSSFDEDNDKGNQTDENIDDGDIFDDESDDEFADPPLQQSLPSRVRSILLFLLTWQFLFNVSDTALSALVVFLSTLFKMLMPFGNKQSDSLINSFPSSLQIVHSQILQGDILFSEYVVCPKCHSVYDIADCLEKTGSTINSKKCHYVQFPQHSMLSRRQPCGTLLMRTVIKHSKPNQFKPFKVYAYQPLELAIKRLLKRRGFLDICEHWHQREKSADYLGDVYDGQLWVDFENFLNHPHSWVLAINVDWFEPYTHVTDAVGVMYLVILNLPRDQRYEKKNMILCGIIPGPQEPSLNINCYLTPLVLELKKFYLGCTVNYISTNGHYNTCTLRLALGGVFSDLPASKKVCGFCSHSAQHGCNKCLKLFPTSNFGESPDFSGFDRSSVSFS
jgi:hypothetical protein